MTARKVYRTNGRQSEADYARTHRLFPGTCLVGDEGYGPTVIEVTALGRRTLLAVTLTHKGAPMKPYEGPWTLSCRDWRRTARPTEDPA